MSLIRGLQLASEARAGSTCSRLQLLTPPLPMAIAAAAVVLVAAAIVGIRVVSPAVLVSGSRVQCNYRTDEGALLDGAELSATSAELSANLASFHHFPRCRPGPGWGWRSCAPS